MPSESFFATANAERRCSSQSSHHTTDVRSPRSMICQQQPQALRCSPANCGLLAGRLPLLARFDCGGRGSTRSTMAATAAGHSFEAYWRKGTALGQHALKVSGRQPHAISATALLEQGSHHRPDQASGAPVA